MYLWLSSSSSHWVDRFHERSIFHHKSLFDQETDHINFSDTESYTLQNLEIFEFNQVNVKPIYVFFFIMKLFLKGSHIIEMLTRIMWKISLILWRVIFSTIGFTCWLLIADRRLLPCWSARLVFPLRNLGNQRHTLWSHMNPSRHPLIMLAVWEVCWKSSLMQKG